MPLIEPLPSLCSPAEAFRAIAGEPWAFFLDSALNTPLGRFSFFGERPFLTFTSKGSRIGIQSHPDRASPASSGKHQVSLVLSGNPFQILRGLIERYSLPNSLPWPPRVPGTGGRDLPPFVGGAVGYFGYDLCHFLERLPRSAEDDLGFSDCALGFYDVVVAFDHLAGEAFVISSGLPEKEPRAARGRAQARMEEFLADLKVSATRPSATRAGADHLVGPGFGRTRPSAPTPSVQSRPSSSTHVVETRNRHAFTSNFTRGEYLAAIQRAKDYIARGDIYQANLSQRFGAALPAPPFEVYQALRRASPAPFAAFLNFPGVAVACASPERFLRVTGRKVQTRPIKGTRPRGKDAVEDEKLARELLNSPKDMAENTMIVDLERNDLGRVCRYGSVKVAEFACLEAYSNVFHLVSTVEGELRPEVGPLDCLAACFPGGSVTGAPKIRAMEIIDELEPTCRSVYTGAIGYLGWDGDVDLNIVIRTLLMAEGKGWFQVGGGIVADSDPEAEYQETLDKAAGLFAALATQRESRVPRPAAAVESSTAGRPSPQLPTLNS